MVNKRSKFLLLAFFTTAFILFSQNTGESAVQNEAVIRKVLDNGLTVLVKESDPKGLVAVEVQIIAGSSFEGVSYAKGISHMVEHMLFKGTGSRKPGDIEREIKSYGGFINGAVSQDTAEYRVVVPSEYLPKTLAVLKDMFRDAAFDAGELSKERDVILKEINLYKDDPERKITRLLHENAYTRHPYRYPGTGYEDGLKSLRRDDLVNFYEARYVPNRMIISVVGGMDAASMLSAVEKEFGDIRRPDYSPLPYRSIEPPQVGARRVIDSASTTLGYLAIAYHSTSILSQDLFALDVLAMILGRGDNSRLNVSLFKEKGLVHTVYAYNHTPMDPGLFTIMAITDADKIQAAESAVLDEIERLKTSFVTDEELERARKTVISDYILSRQTLEGQAQDLASNEALTGRYDFSLRYIDGIKGVTKESVKDAACRYLQQDGMTSVKLIPESATGGMAPVDKYPEKKAAIKKERLPNGLTVIAREDHKIPAVSITMAFGGGLIRETQEKCGISSLTSQMLLKGTRNRGEKEIAGAIENEGGRIEPFSGYDSFGINCTMMKEDLGIALDTIKDIAESSTFPEAELEKERSLAIAKIRAEDDDIVDSGFNIMMGNLFSGYPYGLRKSGTISSISSLSRDDVVKFYNDHCVAENAVIAVSGDIDPATVINDIKSKFKDLPEGASLPAAAPMGDTGTGTRKELLMNKEESLVLIGFRSVDNKSPDKYALQVLSSIMSGHSGRLYSNLRDKMHLAYSLGCVSAPLNSSGFFALYIITTQEMLQAAKKALAAEIASSIQKPPSDEELSLAKRELIFSRKTDMQTNEFFSMRMAIDELCGLGYDDMDKFDSAISAVTKDDVAAVSKKYLSGERSAEVVIKGESK